MHHTAGGAAVGLFMPVVFPPFGATGRGVKDLVKAIGRKDYGTVATESILNRQG